MAGDDAREIKQLMRIVEDINSLEPQFEALNTDALAAKTGEFKERLSRGQKLDDLLPEAYALVRENAPWVSAILMCRLWVESSSTKGALPK
jgi:preprotein translocase subunit SecA